MIDRGNVTEGRGGKVSEGEGEGKGRTIITTKVSDGW